MKVLFVIDSLGSGGAERSTALLQGPLRLLGVETALATLYRADDGDEEFVRAQGVPVYVLSGRNDLGRLLSLRQRIREFQPDVVHTCLYRADQLGRWAAVGTGIPVVSSLVSTPRYVTRGWSGYPPRVKLAAVTLVDWIGARLRSTLMHAVTEGVAEAWIHHYGMPRNKVRVVERGRDANLLTIRTSSNRSAIREELGIADDAPMLISVGRIDRQKQHVHLVRAVDILLNRMPGLRTVILGRDGDARADLDGALRELGERAASISVLGYRPDAPALVAAADVFVMHSKNEGAAGATLEALAVGTPVAAYDVVGLRGVLERGANASIATGLHPEDLALAIRHLLEDPDFASRVAEAGQAVFSQRFTLEVSASKFLDLYRELSGGRSTRTASEPQFGEDREAPGGLTPGPSN